jgi:plastocyanin
MRNIRIVLLPVAIMLMGVACSGDSTNSATTQPPAATTTQTASETPSGGETTGGTTGTSTLILKDNVFDPAELSVAAGSELTLKNEGSNLHNFSIDGQDVDKDVNAGETEQEDVLEGLQPGTYTFFCKYHRSLGMEGTLTITG